MKVYSLCCSLMASLALLTLSKAASSTCACPKQSEMRTQHLETSACVIAKVERKIVTWPRTVSFVHYCLDDHGKNSSVQVKVQLEGQERKMEHRVKTLHRFTMQHHHHQSDSQKHWRWALVMSVCCCLLFLQSMDTSATENLTHVLECWVINHDTLILETRTKPTLEKSESYIVNVSYVRRYSSHK